jgi:hypothetical protein
VSTYQLVHAIKAHEQNETARAGTIVVFLLCCGFPLDGIGVADCTNPARPERGMIYNGDFHVYQFCDGTTVLSVNNAETANSATALSASATGPEIERVSRIAILLLFRRALQTSIDIVETGPSP